MLRRLFLFVGLYPQENTFEASVNDFALTYNSWIKILATMKVGELSYKENLAWLEVLKTFSHVRTEHKRYVG